MEYIIGALITIIIGFFARQKVLSKQSKTFERERDEYSLKNKLVEFAIEKNKIRADIERKSVDDIIADRSKRNGDTDN